MTYKLTCPSCDLYTSALFRAYENGYPCPYCGSSLQQASGQYYRQIGDPCLLGGINLQDAIRDEAEDDA